MLAMESHSQAFDIDPYLPCPSYVDTVSARPEERPVTSTSIVSLDLGHISSTDGDLHATIHDHGLSLEVWPSLLGPRILSLRPTDEFIKSLQFVPDHHFGLYSTEIFRHGKDNLHIITSKGIGAQRRKSEDFMFNIRRDVFVPVYATSEFSPNPIYAVSLCTGHGTVWRTFQFPTPGGAYTLQQACLSYKVVTAMMTGEFKATTCEVDALHTGEALGLVTGKLQLWQWSPNKLPEKELPDRYDRNTAHFGNVVTGPDDVSKIMKIVENGETEEANPRRPPLLVVFLRQKLSTGNEDLHTICWIDGKETLFR